MMLARRMSPVSRLAVEAALVLLEKHQVDRAVFISRHGELERTYKILQALAQEEQVSPTDFSMSVHNTAAGWMTIAAKNALPVTSLTAGKDSFQQGLIEARAMLSVEGVENVLLIDFDGIVPAPYDDASSEDYSPYCVAFILALGNQLTCQRSTEKHINLMPQSLNFLRNFLLENAAFSIGSATGQCQWQRTD